MENPYKSPKTVVPKSDKPQPKRQSKDATREGPVMLGWFIMCFVTGAIAIIGGVKQIWAYGLGGKVDVNAEGFLVKQLGYYTVLFGFGLVFVIYALRGFYRYFTLSPPENSSEGDETDQLS